MVHDAILVPFGVRAVLFSVLSLFLPFHPMKVLAREHK